MSERKINALIIGVSILIPAIIAVLFYTPVFKSEFKISFLPKFHAMLNSGVAVLLLTGVFFIKKKNTTAHRFCMVGALILSTIFLLSYVTYHSSAESTSFGGEGFLKYVYYFILLTHIVLAAVILPLVLFTVTRALQGNFERHKKIARWTFPLWLYVAVSGVLVYILISPYY